MVVAAGSGIRLGGEVPKALRLVGGVPLVTRSVRALVAGGAEAVVVVVAEGLQAVFAAALREFSVPVRLVIGGENRQDSVRNGLVVAGELGARIVLIQDAARALVPVAVVARVLAAVRGGARSVVPVLPVVDSIRRVQGETSQVVDRSELVAVQTPQGFDFETIWAAHERIAAAGLVVTDDAAAGEAMGVPVTLVPGDRLAFKITEPVDLVVAEALVGQIGTEEESCG